MDWNNKEEVRKYKHDWAVKNGYYQRSEYKQHKREYHKIYCQRPEVKKRNQEYKKVYHPLYHQRNQEKICKKSHDYYWANREEVLLKQKRHCNQPEVKKIISKRRKTYREKPKHKKMQKDFQRKYRLGEIITSRILEIEKSFSFIRELYLEKDYDASSIAKKFKTSNSVILAVLRRNSISIKPKIFCNKRAIPCSNGLLVKSNSERVIVETLLQKGIDFVYEQPLPYKDTIYYPDFYLPDRDLFVEFAGLTDKKWYVEQLEKKRKAYQDLQKNVSFITKPEQIVEVLA